MTSPADFPRDPYRGLREQSPYRRLLRERDRLRALCIELGIDPTPPTTDQEK